ncbi:EpsG family protein [Citrobacter werkmanii]|uniref:EpsG family protein n=1 Tax=Citrobacter werkmanii TaxID=67827 RepID=UPI0027251AD7|nr:EpsG family protein [Citrobacter werkmanii]MDO8234126.1 EpsG family protein [Citrobacter werkmanii]
MIPYVLLVLMSLINAILRTRSTIFSLSALIVLISITRYNIGYDWNNYLDIYSNNGDGFFSNEILFYALIRFCTELSLSYEFFVSLCSLITLLFYYKGMRYFSKSKSDFALALSYFVISYCYFEHFNIIRQGIAISIFFYSWKFVDKRKPVWYAAFVIIASCFHSAAILLLPFYFLLRIKSIKPVYYAIVLVLVMVLIRFDIISTILISSLEILKSFDFVARYLSDSNLLSDFASKKSDLGLSKLYPALVFVLCCFWGRIQLDNNRDIIIFNAGFCALFLLLLSFQVDIIFRFFSFFETSLIYLYSLLFYNFNYRSKTVLHTINILIYCIITANMIYIMALVPYSSSLF